MLKNKGSVLPQNTKAHGIAPTPLKVLAGCCFSVTLPSSSPAATRCGRSRRAAARPHTSPGRPRVRPRSSSELYTCKAKGPASPFTGTSPLANPFETKEDLSSSVLPLVKVLEGSSDGVPGFADPHCLQHPRVSQLVQHHRLVKLVWHLKYAEGGKIRLTRPPTAAAHTRTPRTHTCTLAQGTHTQKTRKMNPTPRYPPPIASTPTTLSIWPLCEPTYFPPWNFFFWTKSHILCNLICKYVIFKYNHTTIIIAKIPIIPWY